MGEELHKDERGHAALSSLPSGENVPSEPQESASNASLEDHAHEALEEAFVGKIIVLQKSYYGVPAGTKAKVIGTEPTSSGRRQRLVLGPAQKGQHLPGKLTSEPGP